MLDGGDNVAAGWTPVSLSSRSETLAPGQSGEFRLTIPRVGGEGFRLLEFERERPIAVLLQLTTTDAETQAGTRIADPSYLAFQRSPSESRFWLPDLIATGIRWEPEVPTVGRDVKVIVTVQNQHETVGAGESALVLQVDGKDVGETTLDAMGPGQSIGVEFTWKALDGASIFGAVVDSRSQVEERLETNNRTTANFGGALVPDLVLESLTWSPISPLVGDTLTFTLVVGNQGDLVSGDFRVYVFLDDGISPTWDLAIAGIGKQQRVTTTYAWTAVAGTHTFRVVVDGFNDLVESDKTNNSATASPTVRALADLVIESLTWSPNFPSPGQLVSLSLTLKNQGVVSSGDFRVHVYLDQGSSPTRTILFSSIIEGKSATGSFSWTAQPGPHVFRAVADGGEEVSEIDETNNSATVSITVTSQ